MSKDKTIIVPEVPSTVVPETSVPSIEITDGLESTDLPVTDANGKIDFSSRAYLDSHKPVITPEFASSKFDPEREAKVQAGLDAVSELLGDKINPLIILLARYWEIKPARAAIKKFIDTEAKSLNIPEDRYLQIDLRKNVDTLASLSQAIDRMKYSITYFKPRAGLDSKPSYQMMSIDGIMFNVDLNVLAQAKLTFGEDRVALKAHLSEVSQKVVIDELL